MSNPQPDLETDQPATTATPEPMAAAQPAATAQTIEVPDHAARPAYHRALAPDIARGFMLLFIAIANIPFFIHGFDGPHPPANVPDAITEFIHTMAIGARTFPMFAFLFGYGMVQFYNSRRERGLADKAVRVMLRRRHLGMLLIGALHFFLLFEGDVVGAYGLTGLIIVAIFFRRRDKTILIWALVLYGLLLLATVVGFVVALLNPEWMVTANGAPAQAGVFGYTMSPANPNYFDGMAIKLIMIPVSYLAQAIISPFAAMMMLGWLAARHRLLEDAQQHVALLRKIAIIGISVGWLAGLPVALSRVGLLTQPWAQEWDPISTWLGSFAGVGYVALFGLLAIKWQQRPSQPVLAIANVGQRSLTSYLLQSVIFAPLLSAWGFNLGYQLGIFPAALIAIGVWLISVALCWWLASRNQRGPAEVLLRRITYGAHR